MGEWVETTLGELCRSGGGDIQTGPFGSQLHASDYVTEGIPSVMPQNIGDNKILEEGIARISLEDANRLSRYLLAPGDIVYSRRGDVERRAYVKEDQAGWLCGTGCLRVRVGDGSDARFLSYYLGSPDAREWIVRHAVGATMLNLNTTILGALPVRIPSRKTQEAIAAVLGALDDKIGNNQRIASIADELIRQRYLRIASAAANTVRVGDLGACIRDSVSVRDLRESDNYLALEHMPKRNVWLSEWQKASGVVSDKGRFDRGDVLFGKLRPYFHKVGLALTQGVCSTDILVVRPL